MIITIDGPAGTGKSTIAQKLAKKLNFFYLSSGFIYRSFAHELMQKGILQDEIIEKVCVEEIMKNKFEFCNDQEKQCKIICNHTDITENIKNESCGMLAATLSPIASIRSLAHSLQHDIAQRHTNIIIEGRDCGTVIFPHANIKLYFSANLETRIHRTLQRNIKKNIILDECELKKNIIYRDQKDIRREHGKLQPAYNAYLIETSNLSQEETLNYCLRLINIE